MEVKLYPYLVIVSKKKNSESKEVRIMAFAFLSTESGEQIDFFASLPWVLL